MHELKQVPPAAMTPAQRREEVAGLLANGLFRLRAANARALAEGRPESGFDLGCSGHQRNGMDSSAPARGTVAAFANPTVLSGQWIESEEVRRWAQRPRRAIWRGLAFPGLVNGRPTEP